MIFNKYSNLFDFTVDFEFDPSGNILQIQPGGLSFFEERAYEFLIKTTYLGQIYSNTIRVKFLPAKFVPKINLK